MKLQYNHCRSYLQLLNFFFHLFHVKSDNNQGRNPNLVKECLRYVNTELPDLQGDRIAKKETPIKRRKSKSK